MSTDIAARLAAALTNLLASPNLGAAQDDARAALDAYRGIKASS